MVFPYGLQMVIASNAKTAKYKGRPYYALIFDKKMVPPHKKIVEKHWLIRPWVNVEIYLQVSLNDSMVL